MENVENESLWRNIPPIVVACAAWAWPPWKPKHNAALKKPNTTWLSQHSQVLAIVLFFKMSIGQASRLDRWPGPKIRDQWTTWVSLNELWANITGTEWPAGSTGSTTSFIVVSHSRYIHPNSRLRRSMSHRLHCLPLTIQLIISRSLSSSYGSPCSLTMLPLVCRASNLMSTSTSNISWLNASVHDAWAPNNACTCLTWITTKSFLSCSYITTTLAFHLSKMRAKRV